jgi:hypothetical protein
MGVEMGVGRIEKAPSQGLFSILGGEGDSTRPLKTSLPYWVFYGFYTPTWNIAV